MNHNSRRSLPLRRLRCHFASCAATSSLLLLHRLRHQLIDFAATSPLVRPFHRLLCHLTACAATSPPVLPLHRLCCHFIFVATSPPAPPLYRLRCHFTAFSAVSPTFMPFRRICCQFTTWAVAPSSPSNSRMIIAGGREVILQTLNNATHLFTFIPSVKIFFWYKTEYTYIALRETPFGRGHVERSNTRHFIYWVSLKSYQHWKPLIALRQIPVGRGHVERTNTRHFI